MHISLQLGYRFPVWVMAEKSSIFFHSVLHAVVMVGLEQDSYSVTEGQPVVLVCTEISGDIQRAVVVTLKTEDGTANCKMAH